MQRVLTKTEAAKYLGLSLDAFSQNCNVKPLPFKKVKGERYDVRDLDEWLDGEKKKWREKSRDSGSTQQADGGSSIKSTGGDESLSALHSALKSVRKRNKDSLNCSR